MDVGTSGLVRIYLLNLPGLVGDKYMMVMIHFLGIQRKITDNYVRICAPIGNFIDEKLSNLIYPTFHVSFYSVV